jgi:co-chaperonin GroES (HSP10)
MKALNSFIVVKPREIEQKQTASGLLLTGSETVKQRYQEADVVEVSSLVDDHIKKGDVIAYDAVQGHDYRSGDQTYRIIQYRDVALIL